MRALSANRGDEYPEQRTAVLLLRASRIDPSMLENALARVRPRTKFFVLRAWLSAMGPEAVCRAARPAARAKASDGSPFHGGHARLRKRNAARRMRFPVREFRSHHYALDSS